MNPDSLQLRQHIMFCSVWKTILTSFHRDTYIYIYTSLYFGMSRQFLFIISSVIHNRIKPWQDLYNCVNYHHHNPSSTLSYCIDSTWPTQPTTPPWRRPCTDQFAGNKRASTSHKGAFEVQSWRSAPYILHLFLSHNTLSYFAMIIDTSYQLF